MNPLRPGTDDLKSSSISKAIMLSGTTDLGNKEKLDLKNPKSWLF